MNVYIAYGRAEDQVTALRLQALGAVNGLTVYVPAAHTRVSPSEVMDEASARKLRESDVVLGVVETGLSESCRQELNMGVELNKPTIIMAAPPSAGQLERLFPGRVVVMDPNNPTQAATEIVAHLKQAHMQQGTEKTFLALGAIALGLFVLASQD